MRIAAVSDLHGHLPEIPACDLLIVAGDVCPDGFGLVPAAVAPDLQARWFDQHARPWLAAAPARQRVLIWGNHDWCGERCDFSQDAPAGDGTPLRSLVILNDELMRAPQVTVWGSPWANDCGEWAFMETPRELARRYEQIPEGVDLLVSHQPPFGYGDTVPNYMTGRLEHIGSRELLSTIERVRPRLVICGHIHGGFGRYEHQGIPILNVSVVDEQYRLVNAATVTELPGDGRNGKQ